MIGKFFKTRENRNLVVLIGALLLAFVFVFLPTWQNLVRVWSTSEDYSHGFLIVPLCLFILWLKREELEKAPIEANWRLLPLVVFSLLLYLVALYAGILTLAPLSMILFLGAGVVLLFGWQVFKICLFPLFLLVFMVPVPAQIYAALTIPLQLLVTKVTVFLASLRGIPILREGNVIYLQEHTLQVAQACSGMRSIMALLTLGAVAGYFGLRSNPLRATLIVSAVPIAILVNIVRVFVIVIAFSYLDSDLTHGTAHTVLGMLVFGVALVLFLLFLKVLSLCEK